MLMTRCFPLLQSWVYNLRNALNDRSANHDVAGISTRICSTLENWDKKIKQIVCMHCLQISETVLDFLFGFQDLAVDFLKFSDAGEAFFIRRLPVTDISQSRAFPGHFH